MALNDDLGIMGGVSSGKAAPKLTDDLGLFGKPDLPAGVPTAEQEALQPVGEDPFTQMQRHPYASAAVMGAITGPTGGEATLEALGGPTLGTALSSGAGALEQMGYTGLADIGQKIAGPNHPYLGLALGLAAPLAGGAAVSKALGLKQATRAGTEAETAAKEEVQTTAATAAEKQEAKNLAEHSAAAKKVAGEASQTHAAVAKAASEQGSTNLEGLADAHDMAAKKIDEFATKLDNRAKAVASGGEASEAARNAALAEVVPQEAERQRLALLGRTPAQTQAAQALPPAEAAQRRAAVRQAVFGPTERLSEDKGAQFEEHYAPYRTKEVDPEGVRAAAGDEADYAKQAGAFSRNVTGLVAEAKKLGGEADLEAIIDPKTLDSMDEADKAFTRERMAGGHELSWRDTEGTWHLLTPEQYGAIEKKPTTVQDLLRLRRKASQAIGSERDWPSKAAAWRVVRSIDDALEGADVPKPVGLNQEWKDFRDQFDHTFNRKVSTTIEPSDVMGHIMEEPQRALSLFRYATPEESQTLRDNFADYANSKGYTLADIGSRVNPAVREHLFAGTDLAKAQPWFEMKPKAMELRTVVESSPIAKAQYEAGYTRRMQEIEQDNADQVRKEASALADSLGPAGKPIKAALFKARTPQEVQAAAKQLAQMKPEDVVKALAASQVKPGQAAWEAAQMAKRSARAAFNKLPTTQMRPEEAAQQAVANLPLSGDAARDAIVHLKPSKAEEQLKRFLKFRTLWYGGTIIGGTMMGHTPVYALGMAALDGAMSSFLGTRAIGRAVLRNPKIAETVWNAVKEPKGLGAIHRAGRESATIQALVAMDRAQRQAQAAEQSQEQP